MNECVEKAWIHDLPPESKSNNPFINMPIFPRNLIKTPKGYFCLNKDDIKLAYLDLK